MNNYFKIEDINNQQSSFTYDNIDHHQQQQQQQQIQPNPCYVYDDSLNQIQQGNSFHHIQLNDDELSAAIDANYQLLSEMTNEYYAQTNYINSLQQYPLTDSSTFVNEYYDGNNYIQYPQSFDFTAPPAALSMNVADDHHQQQQQPTTSWNHSQYYTSTLQYVPSQSLMTNQGENVLNRNDIYNNNSDYTSTTTPTASFAANQQLLRPIPGNNSTTTVASTISASVADNNQQSTTGVQQQSKNVNNGSELVGNHSKSTLNSNKSSEESSLAKKLELKRERNRIAARKCRNKKLQQIEELQRTNELLRKDIEKSMAELEVLNKRKFELRAKFLNALNHVPLVNSEDTKQI